jgi:hypothetical protein
MFTRHVYPAVAKGLSTPGRNSPSTFYNVFADANIHTHMYRESRDLRRRHRSSEKEHSFIEADVVVSRGAWPCSGLWDHHQHQV